MKSSIVVLCLGSCARHCRSPPFGPRAPRHSGGSLTRDWFRPYCYEPGLSLSAAEDNFFTICQNQIHTGVLSHLYHDAASSPPEQATHMTAYMVPVPRSTFCIVPRSVHKSSHRFPVTIRHPHPDRTARAHVGMRPSTVHSRPSSTATPSPHTLLDAASKGDSAGAVGAEGAEERLRRGTLQQMCTSRMAHQ